MLSPRRKYEKLRGVCDWEESTLGVLVGPEHGWNFREEFELLGSTFHLWLTTIAAGFLDCLYETFPDCKPANFMTIAPDTVRQCTDSHD
jgi:hypothetical protein